MWASPILNLLGGDQGIAELLVLPTPVPADDGLACLLGGDVDQGDPANNREGGLGVEAGLGVGVRVHDYSFR